MWQEERWSVREFWRSATIENQKDFIVKEQQFLRVFVAPIFALRLLFAGWLQGVTAERRRRGTEYHRDAALIYGLRLAALALASVAASRASTCTPINVPAVIVQGQIFQPAIVNGIDNISYSQVRIQWTSDAATSPVNYQRIVYATAAQWAANGNQIIAGTAGTNYSITFVGSASVTSNTTIQGGIPANLMANTTYHIAGQSSGDGGSTFCPVVDENFTTLPFTGVVAPTPPATFSITTPTVTGTDYTIGVAPCNSGATLAAQFQDCLTNHARPGDGIGIVPTTPIQFTGTSFTLPNNPNATQTTVSGSTFTAAAHGLTNGTQVHVGSTFYPPSPIQEGVTYSVLNASTNTFQLSLDGASPLTLVDAGLGNPWVIRWPISQNYVLIHSTASASALPPSGVRLSPVAYSSSLAKIQLTAPWSPADELFNSSGALTSFYYFKDIEFDLLPSAPATDMDPVPYVEIFEINSQADHIVFDQCYFHPPPPPDRIENMGKVGGTNIAFVNSYFDDSVFQYPMRNGNGTTVTTTTLTVQPHSFNYTTTRNVEHTCTLASPATLTFAGSFEPVYIYWVIPSCVLTANIQTGSIATGAAFNIVTTGTAGYPTIVEPISSTSTPSVLRIGSGFGGGGSVSFTDLSDVGGNPGYVPPSRFQSEANTGLLLVNAAGPIMFINNRYGGQEILGIFQDEYIGNACPGATPCQPVYNSVNLTVQRSSILQEPYLDVTSPSWTGTYWFGRNGPEMKQGRYIRYDGNIIGPSLAGIATGECFFAPEFYGFQPQNVPNVESTSDIEFSNNTCISTPSAPNFSGGGVGIDPPNPQRRIWVHNNLFNQVNGFARNPAPTQQASTGRGIWFDSSESQNVEHNTFYYAGGNGPGGGPQPLFNLSGGSNYSNNILNYFTDSPGSSGFTNDGSASPSIPTAPANTQGSALLAYLHSTTFNNNVYLCEWSTSNPASYVEMTAAACSAAAALYPGNTFFPNTGSTLASRITGVHWFDPANGNFRLNSQSSFIHAATDGFDIGVDMDALQAAQGNVSNVRPFHVTKTGATIGFLAPDAVGCTVDYGTVNFPSGTGSWTRVANSGGQRVQNVTLSGLTTGTNYIYRVNCAVIQPTGTFMTP